MFGVLAVAIAGLVAWKYRDAIAEYVKGNKAPAREKLDELLRTAQEKSETLLDQAKDQISSGLEGAREKLNPRASKEDGGRQAE